MNKDFDKFIKNKFEDRTFDFKEEYWTEAEDMFAVAVPAKRGLFRKIGGWWFVAGVVGMLAIWSRLSISNASENLENQQISETSTIDFDNKESKTTAITNFETKNNSLSLKEKQATFDEKNDDGIEEITENGISQKEITNSALSKRNKTIDNQSIIKGIASTATAGIKKGNQESFNKKETSKTKANRSATKTNNQSNQVIKNNIPTIFNTGNTSKSPNSKTNTTNIPTASQLPTNNKNNIPTESQTIDQNIEQEKTTNTTIAKTKKEGEKEVRTPVALLDLLKTPLFAIENSREMPTLEKATAFSPKEEKFSRYLTFSAVLGGHYATPFENGMANPATQFSLNPIFGVKAGYGLNKKIDVHVGVLTYNRTQTNTIIQTNTLTYGFGFQQTTQNIAINKLRFVEVPIYGSYRFTEKAEVLFGFAYSNLFSTVSSVEEFTADSNTKLQLTNQGTVNNYMEGLRRHDVGVLAGIQYRFSPLMTVGGQLKYGVRDLTDNAYYNNDSYDRNVQFRVMLTFDLLSRSL